MKNKIVVIVGLGACVLASGAFAAINIDGAVLARKAELKDISKAYKAIHAISASQIGTQRASLVMQTQRLKILAPQPWTHFGPETASTKVKNEARAAIWKDAVGFHAAQTKFIMAVNALNDSAGHGTPDAVAQKVADVGASCKACHRTFKS